MIRTRTLIAVGGGLAAVGGLYWLSRPRAFLQTPVAPVGAVALQPVVLPLPTVPLIRGRHYYAVANVGSFVHAFASIAQVVAYVQKKGFTNVFAYASSDELPAWWPAAARTGASGTFWAEGTWNQASQQTNLPSQVVAAWILGPETL